LRPKKIHKFIVSAYVWVSSCTVAQIMHILSCFSPGGCAYIVFVGNVHKFMGFLHSFGHINRVDSVYVGIVLYM
jgi:hypothetical protein